jgi:hypothetical protein
MTISTILSNAGISGTQSGGGAGQVGSAAQSGAAQGITSTSSSGSASISSGDEVSLSGVSQLLNNGAAQRTGMLASLASAVQGGSYSVSSSQVGTSMVSEMLARSGGLW